MGVCLQSEMVEQLTCFTWHYVDYSSLFSSSQYFSSLSTLFICRVVFFIFTLFYCYLYLREYSFFERMFQNNYIFFPFFISPCISFCPLCLSAYPFNDNNHVNLIIIKMLLFSIIVLMSSILFFLSILIRCSTNSLVKVVAVTFSPFLLYFYTLFFMASSSQMSCRPSSCGCYQSPLLSFSSSSISVQSCIFYFDFVFIFILQWFQE